MNALHFLSLVAIAGIWSLVTAVRSRGDREIALKILTIHAVGFPSLVLIRAVVAPVATFDLAILGAVEALSVLAALTVVHLVDWEAFPRF